MNEDSPLKLAYKCMVAALTFMKCSVKAVSTIRLIHGGDDSQGMKDAIEAESLDMAKRFIETGMVGDQRLDCPDVHTVMKLCRWIVDKSLQEIDPDAFFSGLTAAEQEECEQYGGLKTATGQEFLVYLAIEKFLDKLEQSPALKIMKERLG